jgi:hypothetical protein
MYRIIKMTGHARTRALERGIDEIDIEKVIDFPAETVYSSYEENYISYGLVVNQYTKEERYLLIIHTILNKYVKIITVMWKDRGGLKGYGFSNV